MIFSKYLQNFKIKLIIIICLIIIIYLIFTPSSQQPSTNGTKQDFAVEIIELSPEKHTIYISSIGDIIAQRKSEIKADNTGKIVNLYHNEGNFIKEGDILATYATAEHANILEKAKNSFLKQQEIVKDYKLKFGTNSFPTQEALKQLKLLKERLNIAENYSKLTEIRAPYDGFLEKINFRINESFVKTDIIFLFVDNNSLELNFKIHEKYLNTIDTQKPLKVKILNNELNDVFINYIGKTIEQNTRFANAKAVLPNQKNLIDGMSADVKIPLIAKFAVKFPRSSLIIDDSGQPSIKAVDENNNVIIYNIRILEDSDQYLWATGNFPKKIKLITRGIGFVNVGDKVTIEPNNE